MQIIDPARLRRAKLSFAVRRVPAAAMRTLIVDERRPMAGDLVLARVTKIGSHGRIELPCGRRATLLPGDEIILAFGDRYAPDQFEAYVPMSLEPCHMVAAGGVASLATSWHDRISGPTRIEPIGLVGDAQGLPLNLKRFALPKRAGRLPGAVAVFGTAMNAGKTTAAAKLVHGLDAAGVRVAAAKVTGTAAGGDLWLMRDHGARDAVDFTDAGYATTFNADPTALVAATERLLQHLAHAADAEFVVVEIADGLFQRETAALAASPAFRALFEGTMFCAGDAMGAVSGVQSLERQGHRIVAVAGAMTRAPLAVREAQDAFDAPVLTSAELAAPGIAELFAGTRKPQAAEVLFAATA